MIKVTKKATWTVLIMLIAAMMILLNPSDTHASSLVPIAKSNISVSGVSESAMATTAEGFVRVFYDSGKVYAEDYDDDLNITGRREIPMELSIYGGFFSGSDAYYVVFGQLNKEEDTNAEVIRVVKYDKEWNRLGAAKLKGDSAFAHEIRIPFDAGNLNMAEYDGMLYLVTGHEGYVDESVGQGHQGFLMYKVDESTMNGSIVDADLWHSFAQHIAIKDQNNIYTVEECEGSMCTRLTKRTTANYYGTEIPVLKYGGETTSVWAIPTYATVDGIALSDNNVLTIGSSIDQTKYYDETYTKEYRIYITKTPMDSFTKDDSTVEWLTAKNVKSGFRGIKITKVNDGRFMISWSEYNEKGDAEQGKYSGLETKVLHYIFVDGDGKKVSKEYTVSGSISECDPVVKNGKAVFYASDNGSVVFYSVNTDSGDISKKEILTAGSNAVWEFDDGVLTVSGTGEIKESFGPDSLSVIEDKLTKIVIKSGITKISDRAFSDSISYNEVVLEDGVTEIGDGAFYGNPALEKITVPSSVTKIADNAFDTGYYWTYDYSPVRNVTIYCETGSYAESYAKEQRISYMTPEKAADEDGQNNDNDQTPEWQGPENDYNYDNGSDKVPAGVKEALKAADKGKDPSGSSFAPLKLKAKTVTAGTVRLAWNNIPGAVKYAVYGNRSGNAFKMKKLGTVEGKSYAVKKISNKLKKKTYYKFIIIAFDEDDNIVSISKVIHAATSGSAKMSNPRKIEVRARISKTGKQLKKYKKTTAIKMTAGKKTRLKAKVIKSKKARIKKYFGLRYESSNKRVATVNNKGVISAVRKGKCTVYAYAQNGVSKAVRVTVK